ncbi:sulfatase-like hydrolase/transferase [Planctomycetota bacterium]|nr:sulfatase-like hydrolase/transferase [Planctomycetota bacterium]
MEDLQYVNDLYDAEILEIDTLVGELLDRLEAAGKLDNTLIIVTSDHGEEFQDHGHFEHGWSLYQEQLFVPLIVHYPGIFEGGLRIDYPTIGIDVAPTIASIAGAAIPGAWSGVALGPEAPETDRPIWIPYRQRETGTPATALRDGDQKYIYFPKITRPHDPGGDQRLYDLAEDAVELNDIWRSNAVRQKRWERAVRAYEQAYPLRYTSSEAKSGGDLADQLKALGYGGD